MIIDKSKGLGSVNSGQFVKTFAPGSSEHLAIIKLDQLVAALAGVLHKLDADTGVNDTNYFALWNIAYSASDQLIPSPAQPTSI